jgi:hypothetical protein
MLTERRDENPRSCHSRNLLVFLVLSFTGVADPDGFTSSRSLRAVREMYIVFSPKTRRTGARDCSPTPLISSSMR